MYENLMNSLLYMKSKGYVLSRKGGNEGVNGRRT